MAVKRKEIAINLLFYFTSLITIILNFTYEFICKEATEYAFG